MKKTKLQYLHFTKEILIEKKKEKAQKTKLNNTIPLTGTIEFKLWNQNGGRA